MLENNSKPSCKYELLRNHEKTSDTDDRDEEGSISNEAEFKRSEQLGSKITSVHNPYYDDSEYLGSQNRNNNNNNDIHCTNKMASQKQCTEQTRNSIVNMLTRIVRSALNPQDDSKSNSKSFKRAVHKTRVQNLDKNLSIEDVQMNVDEKIGDKIQLSLLIPSNCFKKEDLAALKNKKCIRIPRGSSSLSNAYYSSDEPENFKPSKKTPRQCLSKRTERERKNMNKYRQMTNLNKCLNKISPVNSVTSNCYFENHDFNYNDENTSSISCFFVLFVVFSAFVNVLFGKV
jgi:hypothetical protein